MNDLENNVVFLPHRPRINDYDLQFVIEAESESTDRLARLHGDITSVPMEKLQKLDIIMNALENLLKS